MEDLFRSGIAYLGCGFRIDHRGAMNRYGFTLLETLVAIAIVGVMIALTASAISAIRAHADRTTCANQLRQIGLGLHQYHDQHRRLPRGVRRSDTDYMPRMGWQGPILPFMGQENLWDAQRKAWANSDDSNSGGAPVRQTVVLIYSCPSDTFTQQLWTAPNSPRANDQLALGNYLGVPGISLAQQMENPAVQPEGILFEESRMTFGQITDGLSQTLAAGERPVLPRWRIGQWYFAFEVGDALLGVEEGNYKGLAAEDLPNGPCEGFAKYQPRNLNTCDNYHYWSYHPGGSNFLFADGSQRFLTYRVEPFMKALSTRAGGDAVTLPGS